MGTERDTLNWSRIWNVKTPEVTRHQAEWRLPVCRRFPSIRFTNSRWHMIFVLDQVDFVEANYRIYECIEMNGMFCSRYIYISIPENHKIWAAERINVLLTNLYSCNQNSPETNINTAAPNFILMWVAEENRKPHGGTYTRVRTRWPHHIHVYIYMYIWKLTKRATEAWMTATRTI